MMDERRSYEHNPEVKRGLGGMEVVDGDPVCAQCLSGTHYHDNKAERSDCKHTDIIDGEMNQCMCGLAGRFYDKESRGWIEVYDYESGKGWQQKTQQVTGKFYG
jgi:hypothetical protein